MLVPVDNHVQAVVDSAETLRLELLAVVAALALHLNVFSSGDLPLFVDNLAFNILPCLVGIGKGSVVSFTLDARFDHASTIRTGLTMLEECLDHLRFFEVLIVG